MPLDLRRQWRGYRRPPGSLLQADGSALHMAGLGVRQRGKLGNQIATPSDQPWRSSWRGRIVYAHKGRLDVAAGQTHRRRRVQVAGLEREADAATRHGGWVLLYVRRFIKDLGIRLAVRPVGHGHGPNWFFLPSSNGCSRVREERRQGISVIYLDIGNYFLYEVGPMRTRVAPRLAPQESRTRPPLPRPTRSCVSRFFNLQI